MRGRTTLAPAASSSRPCPVPGLAVRCAYEGQDGTWWVGALLEAQARVVAGPSGRLDLTGPGTLVDEHSAFRPHWSGPLHRVSGEVDGRQVGGAVDQPGTRGYLRNLTAFTRRQHRVRLQLSDGRAWWVAASGALSATVTRSDGSTVARGSTGAKVDVADGSSGLDVAVALLLLTGVDRESLLAVGSVS